MSERWLRNEKNDIVGMEQSAEVSKWVVDVAYERGWQEAIEAAAQHMDDGGWHESAKAIRSLRPSPAQEAPSKSPLAALAQARLDEAKWWEHLVVHEDDNESSEPDCMYCKRIAELEAALAATGKETP